MILACIGSVGLGSETADCGKSSGPRQSLNTLSKAVGRTLRSSYPATVGGAGQSRGTRVGADPTGKNAFLPVKCVLRWPLASLEGCNHIKRSRHDQRGV